MRLAHPLDDGRKRLDAQLAARPSLSLSLVEQPILLRGRQRGDPPRDTRNSKLPAGGKSRMPGIGRQHWRRSDTPDPASQGLW